MSALECVALDVLSASSEALSASSVLRIETALRDGRVRAHRQNSSLYKSSAAMLTCGVAAGWLGLAYPTMALAQDSGVAHLPDVVVDAPTQKPAKPPVKRRSATHAASNRGPGRTNQPVQEAAPAGAGA